MHWLKSCHRLALQSQLQSTNTKNLAAQFHALPGVIEVARLSKTDLRHLGFVFVVRSDKDG